MNDLAEKHEARNIGINVNAPTESCTDRNCPFHGNLPVRGHIITGYVVSNKMKGSISVKKDNVPALKNAKVIPMITTLIAIFFIFFLLLLYFCFFGL